MASEDGFTRMTTATMRRLYDAKASGVEILAYAMLTRYHNDEEHPARCWRSAQLVESELGMRVDVFCRALRSLTKKTFDYDGRKIPILTKVSDGHNGRAAVFNDNLYAVAVLRDASSVA